MKITFQVLKDWMQTVLSYITPSPAAETVTEPAANESVNTAVVAAKDPTVAVAVQASATAPAVSAKPVVDVVATIKSYILSQTKAFGPSPTTGGQIHKIDDATAGTLATLICHYAPFYDLEPAFVAAGICGESRFDPSAINPNFQDAKSKNETDEEQFMHTDIGLCQFDGATLIAADGIFGDLRGLTFDQIKPIALNPDWAVQHFCAFVAKLIKDTAAELKANPHLLDHVKNGSLDELAVEAYNAGEHGAEEQAEAGTELSYGERWMSNYADITALLKG